MRKFITFLLVSVLCISVCACGTVSSNVVTPTPTPEVIYVTPEPVAEEADFTSPDSFDSQLNLILQSMSTLNLSEDWSCMICDLDHNDRLELFVAAVEGSGHFTSGKLYEVSKAYDVLEEINLNLKEGEFLPDVIVESADTYHDTGTDTWFYIMKDTVKTGAAEGYSARCSISLKDGVFTTSYLASETTEIINGHTAVTYKDASGNIITPEEFNASGDNAFAKMEKSGTNFDWFKYNSNILVARLADSFSVFRGLKAPEQKPEETPAPTSSPTIIVTPGYLMITKDPTSEYPFEGENACFVAKADNWDSCVWTFVSPYGYEQSWQSAAASFPYLGMNGVNNSTLYLSNVPLEMNGYGVYCTFYGNNQSARTNTAFLNVCFKPAPAPTPTSPVVYNSIRGTVVDFGMSSVSIQADNGVFVQVLKDICSVPDNDLRVGAPCTLYYTGTDINVDSVYHVDVDLFVGPVF